MTSARKGFTAGDVPIASGQGDKETPASEFKSSPRDHTSKCLKSPSGSFQKRWRNFTPNARKQAQVGPLLFLPPTQHEAINRGTGGNDGVEVGEGSQTMKPAAPRVTRGPDLWVQGGSEQNDSELQMWVPGTPAQPVTRQLQGPREPQSQE